MSENYDYYNKLSDPDLLTEMRTAVAVLQMSNQEDLACAVTAFVDRYNEIAKDLNQLLTKEYMRDDYRTKG